MQQWRAHPDAEAIINTSFNLCLEEDYGVLANAALDFALIELNLCPQISENLMEPSGLEPLTPCMPCRCSTS